MSGKTLSLTLPQFLRRLQTLSDATPVGLMTVTEPTMRRRGNPWLERVVKVTRCNAWIGANYARQVNRQRVREQSPPDFESVPRTWGRRIRPTPLVLLVSGNGRKHWYLDCRVIARRWVYRDAHTGEEIDESELLPWLIRSRPSRRQRVQRHIILRDYRVDRIAELRVAGEVWRPRRCWNRLSRLITEERT